MPCGGRPESGAKNPSCAARATASHGITECLSSAYVNLVFKLLHRAGESMKEVETGAFIKVLDTAWHTEVFNK